GWDGDLQVVVVADRQHDRAVLDEFIVPELVFRVERLDRRLQSHEQIPDGRSQRTRDLDGAAHAAPRPHLHPWQRPELRPAVAERAFTIRHAYPELIRTVQVLLERDTPLVIRHSTQIPPRHTGIIWWPTNAPQSAPAEGPATHRATHVEAF